MMARRSRVALGSGDRIAAQRLLRCGEAVEQAFVEIGVDRPHGLGELAHVCERRDERAVERLGLRTFERVEWAAAAEEARVERLKARNGVIDRPGQSVAEVLRRMVRARL